MEVNGQDKLTELIPNKEKIIEIKNNNHKELQLNTDKLTELNPNKDKIIEIKNNDQKELQLNIEDVIRLIWATVKQPTKEEMIHLIKTTVRKEFERNNVG